MDGNELGAYLRARRDLVTPEQAGVVAGGPRRVPGLRREEVALLAGISADYYLRLERGRDRHPSAQVLESLARVLCLDDEATSYLLGLADPAAPRARARRARPQRVPTHLVNLLEVVGVPAFVEGRAFDVLAANRAATALSPRLSVGANRLRSMFLDPAERDVFPDWDAGAARMVAGFRRSVAGHEDDPRVVELVGELSIASPAFRRLWARHDVRGPESAPVVMNHPVVGTITLNREKLTSDDGLVLVMYHPDAGSAAADQLAVLNALDATRGDAVAPDRRV